MTLYLPPPSLKAAVFALMFVNDAPSLEVGMAVYSETSIPAATTPFQFLKNRSNASMAMCITFLVKLAPRRERRWKTGKCGLENPVANPHGGGQMQTPGRRCRRPGALVAIEFLSPASSGRSPQKSED